MNPNGIKFFNTVEDPNDVTQIGVYLDSITGFVSDTKCHVHTTDIKTQEHDYESLQPYFGWLPINVIND